MFSYVVDHDHGYAPNPSSGLCTLAKCKYGSGRKNVIELAEPGDWVIGTGGKGPYSTGRGTLLYAMRVDDKIPLSVYCSDEKFKGRIDSEMEIDCEGRFALLSRHYYYFGKNAISIEDIPKRGLGHSLEKRGHLFVAISLRDSFLTLQNGLMRNSKLGFTACLVTPVTILVSRRESEGRASRVYCARPSLAPQGRRHKAWRFSARNAAPLISRSPAGAQAASEESAYAPRGFVS